MFRMFLWTGLFAVFMAAEWVGVILGLRGCGELPSGHSAFETGSDAR